MNVERIRDWAQHTAARATIAGGLLLAAQHADVLPRPVRNLDPVFGVPEVAADHDPRNHKNWKIPEGWFYTETRGSAPYPSGFSVTGPMWEAYQRHGGVKVWGPPVSQEFVDSVGRPSQAFQRGIFQTTVRSGVSVKEEWDNVFDRLRRTGNWPKLLPEYFSWPEDAELWKKGERAVYENHLRKVFTHSPETNPVPQKYLDILKNEYTKDPKHVAKSGFPMGVALFEEDKVVVMVAQRSAYQLWLTKRPWTSGPMQVTVALAGDIAKQNGLLPAEAINPILPNGVKQEVLAPGEFRVGNKLFRNFGEHRGYMEDNFNWLRGTGAMIGGTTIWNFIQNSPTPYILFNPSQRPPEFTDAFTGYIGLNLEGLYNSGYNREAQRAIMIGNIVHGTVHSRQFKEVNYNPKCGQMLNFEIEAWTTEAQTYRTLVPFVGQEAQGQLAFAASWVEEQVRNRNLPYCLP